MTSIKPALSAIHCTVQYLEPTLFFGPIVYVCDIWEEITTQMVNVEIESLRG